MTERPPEHGPEQATGHATSIVIVNTGDGKGKTTAAMGTALRAVARGWKVAVVQFIKSGQWRVGEEDVGRTLGIDWETIGEGFTWDSENLDRAAEIARDAWAAAKAKIAAGSYDLVVLDEATYPMTWGWIDIQDVVETITRRPDGVNIIITGRDAPDALVEVADTVTEMRNVKHAFDAGIAARRGIDY